MLLISLGWLWEASLSEWVLSHHKHACSRTHKHTHAHMHTYKALCGRMEMWRYYDSFIISHTEDSFFFPKTKPNLCVQLSRVKEISYLAGKYLKVKGIPYFLKLFFSFHLGRLHHSSYFSKQWIVTALSNLLSYFTVVSLLQYITTPNVLNFLDKPEVKQG